jgi:hypothetical protein
MTRHLLLFDSYCLVFVGFELSGSSPLGLETIFYSLSFEISLFVASYDSKGHGGGIRPRLHTGRCGVSFAPFSLG